jgi:hypothetical protein
MIWWKKIGAVAIVGAGGMALAAYLGVARGAVSQTMHAYVHQDASIGLNFDDGSAVGSQAAVPPTIPPGTYSISVLDDTSEHNFHLSGPGVDQSTDIGGSSTPTWSVTLQPGRIYRFQCDNHPDFMYGVFQTSGTASGSGSSGGSGGSSSGTSSSGGSVSSTGTSSGGTKSSLSGTLAATLSSAGVVTLKTGGRTVSKLVPGRYRITIADKAPTRSFVLQRKGGKAIAITHPVTVTLTIGLWSFYSQPGTKSRHSFSVA